MIPSAVHDDRRLAALAGYAILDTPPDVAFDDVVAVASQLCEVPVALVSLVAAERQWFKARVGFDPCETTIGQSVCAHALGQTDVLVIPDLTKDPRTRDNTLVTEAPFIRFYAGAPLIAPAGEVLGTLCVIDTMPRETGLTASQTIALQALARQVMTLLEMRKAVSERDQARLQDRRRGRSLELLAQFAAALLETSDPATTLRPFLEAGATDLGFDRSFTYDVTKDGDHLALTHSVGIDEAARTALAHVPFDVPLCGIVARSGERLVLADLNLGAEPRYAIAREAGIRAYAGFPIVSGGAIRGVIAFASTVSRSFDDESLTFFETIARFLSIARERVAAVQALTDSDTRSRLAQEAGRIGTFEVDVATDEMTVSPEFCRIFGLAGGPTFPAKVLEALIVPEDKALHSSAASRREGSSDPDVEYRIRRADSDRVRWIMRHAQFVRDARGAIVRMFGAVHDVTERKTTEAHQAALLDLGDRLRLASDSAEAVGIASEILGRTLDVSRAGFGVVDVGNDRFDVERDWISGGSVSLVGRHGLSGFQDTFDRLLRGETIAVANVGSAAWLAADARSYEAIGTRAQIKIPLVDKGELVGVLYAHERQPRTWTKDEIEFVHGVADRVYAALAKLKAESHQRLLNQELSHRLKNTLALVQAVATQTLKPVTERAAVDAFTKRLLAISAAHDVLLQQSWSAARIDALSRSVLGMFGMPERFDLSGPDVTLGSRASLSLSMLLHELSTNALKYGSLSSDDGRVTVAWRVDDAAEAPELVLDWRETGGPAPKEPGRQGFGSRLIRMGLIGTGGVEVRFMPQGLDATFKAPLAQVQS